jgi:hypothetical protein
MTDQLDGVLLLELILTGVLIGVIPGMIAQRKGHNFFVWWLFGAMLFLFALPAALILKPNRFRQRPPRPLIDKYRTWGPQDEPPPPPKENAS